MWSGLSWDYWRWQCLSLTRAELGPGTSPLVSGSERQPQIQIFPKTPVRRQLVGAAVSKMEEGPGRDGGELSLGSFFCDELPGLHEQQGHKAVILVTSSHETAVAWYVCMLYMNVHIPFSHIVHVPGFQVLILQVFTNVASRSENTVSFLIDLPLLIVTLSLWNQFSEREERISYKN